MKLLQRLFVAAMLFTFPCTFANSQQTEFSAVENPTIPTKVQFAGQTISFDRIDMYERLDR